MKLARLAPIALLLFACGTSDTDEPLKSRDGGGSIWSDAGIRDAGPPRDGGVVTRDAGEPPRDGGDVARDGGPPRDAGVRDAGPPRDGGLPIDGGEIDGGEIDAGTRDGGLPRDAGPRDGGTPRDGGPGLDAGTRDGGPVRDGGATGCTVAGIYQATFAGGGTFFFDFAANGQWNFGLTRMDVQNNPMVGGTWTYSNGQFTITDTIMGSGCGAAVGTYTVAFNATCGFTLTVVTDACAGRSMSLNGATFAP